MISVFEHPWFRGLFGDAEAAALWSADTQLDHYRAFEAALSRALEASGRLPSGQGKAAARIAETAAIDIRRLSRGTATDGLPVPDFVRQLRSAAEDTGHAIHTGATSQDVLDTALALTLKTLTDLLVDRLMGLDMALAGLEDEFGSNRLIGRTRMQAALPISVADRLAAWRVPLAAHIDGLNYLRPRVERLQFGGAVGTRSGFGERADDIARHMAESLGLRDSSVWHSDRTGLGDYAGRLSLMTGTLGKVGQDITLMAQQGIDEIEISGGGGSSAMPHKSNPVLAELLVTLARFNATQLAGMHQALVHEQERSGAAWMLEWMILPQMSVATARALTAAQSMCKKIQRLGET